MTAVCISFNENRHILSHLSVLVLRKHNS